MDEQKWYRAECRRDPAGCAAELLDSLALLTRGGVALREPELHSPIEGVDPSWFFEGAELDPSRVRTVLTLILDDTGVRCTLESSGVVVHGVGDAVYIRLDSTGGTSISHRSSHLEVLPTPAPSLEAELRPPHPAADHGFWRSLSIRVETEEVLLLNQWAAGLGGERWYKLSNVEQVSLVREAMLFRSIIALFPANSFAVIAGRVPEIRTQLSRPIFGEMRWLVPLVGDLRLEAEAVNDNDDLEERLASPANGSLVFQWPIEGTGGVQFAAVPDLDGIVRTRSRFD